MIVKFKFVKNIYILYSKRIKIIRNYSQNIFNLGEMTENKLLERSRSIVPKLEKDRHKGQCGNYI